MTTPSAYAERNVLHPAKENTSVCLKPCPWAAALFIQHLIKEEVIWGEHGKNQMKTGTCFGSWPCLGDSLNCGIEMIQEENISDLCFPQSSRPERKLPQWLFIITECAFCYQRMVCSSPTVALSNHKSVNNTVFPLPKGISADILHSFLQVLSRLTSKHKIALTCKCFIRMYFRV